MVNPVPHPSKEATLPNQVTDSVAQLPLRPLQKERVETSQNKEIEAHIDGLTCPDDFDVNSNELKLTLDEFGTHSQISEEIEIGSRRHSPKASDLTTNQLGSKMGMTPKTLLAHFGMPSMPKNHRCSMKLHFRVICYLEQR